MNEKTIFFKNLCNFKNINALVHTFSLHIEKTNAILHVYLYFFKYNQWSLNNISHFFGQSTSLSFLIYFWLCDFLVCNHVQDRRGISFKQVRPARNAVSRMSDQPRPAIYISLCGTARRTTVLYFFFVLWLPRDHSLHTSQC